MEAQPKWWPAAGSLTPWRPSALTTAQETVNAFAASLSEGHRRAFLSSPSVATMLTG